MPTGLSWYTNMADVSLLWNTNMAAVTSCENALYIGVLVVYLICAFIGLGG